MESQHMTQQVFANFLEMSPATLSSIFNDRTRPTLSVVEAIKKKIPNVNIEWLMFGSGEIFLASGDGESSGDSASGVQQGGLFDEQDADDNAIDFGSSNFDAHSGRNNSISGYQMSPSDHHSPASYASGQGTKYQQPAGRHSRVSEPMHEDIRFVERPPRKVTEIRVYYDDLTYETFVPAKK